MRMKRTCVVALCLAVAITCSGCKSKEVQIAENLINSIGDFTIYKHERLDAALAAYNDLDDKEKSKVENVEALNSSLEHYQKIVSEEAETIIDSINEIPQPVNPDDNVTTYRVAACRNKISSTTDDVLAEVTNIDVLEAAEKTIEDDTVQKAIDAIDAIGTVSLKKSDLIEAANTAYKKVPDSRTADVTNKDVLTAANAELYQLEKEEKEKTGKAALATLRTQEDEVESITWYYPLYLSTVYQHPSVCSSLYRRNNWAALDAVKIQLFCRQLGILR